MNGIVHKYQPSSLRSFKGPASYAACDVMRWDSEPSPTLGDVRRAVRDCCVLPMLSAEVHQAAPPVRSVLIAGARGSGKRALVNAVCAELGATLFDLTSDNIVGKYPGKSGLTMLLHLVNKVARFAPFFFSCCSLARQVHVRDRPGLEPKRTRSFQNPLLLIVHPFKWLTNCTNNNYRV